MGELPYNGRSYIFHGFFTLLFIQFVFSFCYWSFCPAITFSSVLAAFFCDTSFDISVVLNLHKICPFYIEFFYCTQLNYKSLPFLN